MKTHDGLSQSDKKQYIYLKLGFAGNDKIF